MPGNQHTNNRTLHMYLAARQLKGRLCQPPPVALTMLSEHTRCGDSTASFIAIMPPMLWPTMCAASQSRCVCKKMLGCQRLAPCVWCFMGRCSPCGKQGCQTPTMSARTSCAMTVVL